MSRIINNWLQRTAQQGVFMKVANLHSIARSGPTRTAISRTKSIHPNDKYFVVGKTIVGGEEVVGG